MLLGAGLLLTGCTQGGLDPRGSEADRIFSITTWLVIVGTVVTVAVFVLLALAVRRPGSENLVDPDSAHVGENRLERRLVIGGGIVMPAVVLAGFFVVQIASTVAQQQTGEVVVEVTGHQFWWEAHYRDVDGVEPFDTANELHVPVGTPVTVVLRTDDVIHSFWVPQLAGKLDMVPGRENRFTFTADEPGTYAGECAEFCGLQHAWMKFEVVATTPDEFDSWARLQAEPAAEAGTGIEDRGRELFLDRSCAGCHTIRGVSEDGDVGPDLTHLAGRDEIGAGVRPLNEDTLAAWISNAQAIKPGVQMPPQHLTREELDAVVAYLMSLE